MHGSSGPPDTVLVELELLAKLWRHVVAVRVNGFSGVVVAGLWIWGPE